MENKNVLYGIIGLLAGLLIMGVFNSKGNIESVDKFYSTKTTTHQMPDGTMMGNVGMDMDSMMSGMMAGLDGKTGDEFDKEFLSTMIIHHQGAVVMAEAVLKTSKRPELLKLAQDIITAQTKEIGMMQSWQNTWYK